MADPCLLRVVTPAKIKSEMEPKSLPGWQNSNGVAGPDRLD